MANANAFKADPIAGESTGEIQQQLLGLGLQTGISLTSFSAHWLADGECRLDASYYANEAFAAQRVISDCGYAAKSLGEVAGGPFYPGRFKRILAKTEAEGVPFLTASGMLQFRPRDAVFLSNRSAYLDSCRVTARTLLITRSGSVGRCALVGRRLSRFAISDDAIRVLPSDIPSGYIYAFLTSRIGQALITKDQYGSSIKHLEPHHIANVPVPLVPQSEQQAISKEIIRAYELRDEANDLLDEANNLLYSELGLRPFDESKVPYFPVPNTFAFEYPDMPHPRAFEIKATELDERLDVSYHLPVARTAVKMMAEAKYAPVRLDTMAARIFMPPTYKRIYVAREFGEPILSGSHLFQMSPHNLQFISPKVFKKNTIEKYRVHKGWVLVTGRGTIGKILAKPALVSDGWDGWLASHNILRIVPKTSVNGGYLTAFLLSEYGSLQIDAKGIGVTVSVITPEDLANIWIPNPPRDVQESIGERVTTAFEKKDKASAIEEAAIQRLENLLEPSA